MLMFAARLAAGSLLSPCRPIAHVFSSALKPVATRSRSNLAPKKMTRIRRQKGTIPIPTGGSTKGTTLAYGDWGIRIKGMGVRFSAKQLTTAEEVIKRKIKIVKGAKVYLRIFPDIPVCIKVKV